MSEPSELNLASVKELIEELMSRHTSLILITDNELTKSVGDIGTFIQGNYIYCLGLVEHAKSVILDIMYGEEENPYEDQDNTAM